MLMIFSEAYLTFELKHEFELTIKTSFNSDAIQNCKPLLQNDILRCS